MSHAAKSTDLLGRLKPLAFTLIEIWTYIIANTTLVGLVTNFGRPLLSENKSLLDFWLKMASQNIGTQLYQRWPLGCWIKLQYLVTYSSKLYHNKYTVVYSTNIKFNESLNNLWNQFIYDNNLS